MHRHKFILLPLLLLSALSVTAEVTVRALFNPPRIMLGDKARYIVEIKESSSTKMPSMEEVKTLPISRTGGLQLSNGRTSTGGKQTSIFNGTAQYSASQQLIIDAAASTTGKFTIPSYTFQYGGETLRVPAATLEVVERTADAAPRTDELIFLKVDAPEQLYVGQTTKIDLKMYISDQVRLRSLVNFDRSTDGFTISELPDNQENAESYNGRRYRVLKWPLTITPINSGEQDLNFEFTVAAQMPGQSNRREPFGGSMGNSIIDDFFGRTARYTLYTEPTQIEVLPLPTADQPANFSGAIGSFALEVTTDREETVQGEPIMLSIEVAGEGNFDRISGPTIAENANWRSYEPESKFIPRSASDSLRGTKRFDYVMIPKKAGTLTLPEAAFSYFDPIAKRYVEMKAPKIQIEVSPSNNPPASTTPTANSSPSGDAIIAQPIQHELSIEEALLTLDYQKDGATASDGDSIIQRASFWVANTFAALALAASGYITHRKRRLAEDPIFAAKHAAKQELAEARKAATAAKDIECFYQEAQKAIRLAISCQTGRNLRAATPAEISLCGISDATAKEITDLFDAADAHRFSKTESSSNLTEAKAGLERILKAI